LRYVFFPLIQELGTMGTTTSAPSIAATTDNRGIILATLFAIPLFLFGPGFSALFGGRGGAGGLFGGGADGGSGLLR
jgi:hypothetical protein